MFVFLCFFFFFFKQKTAYEMRISDWSSDVCSSDLGGTRTRTREGVARLASRRACGTWATPPMAGTALGERGRSGALAAATARARGTALGRAGIDRQRAFAVGVATARPEGAGLAGALARRCAAQIGRAHV